MAQVKLTLKRGFSMSSKDVVVAAGSAEAQTDTISLNMDSTKLTKGEVILMLEALQQQIFKAKWPQL